MNTLSAILVGVLFGAGIDENPGNQDERTGFFPYRMEITLTPAKQASAPSDDEEDES